MSDCYATIGSVTISGQSACEHKPMRCIPHCRGTHLHFLEVLTSSGGASADQLNGRVDVHGSRHSSTWLPHQLLVCQRDQRLCDRLSHHHCSITGMPAVPNTDLSELRYSRSTSCSTDFAVCACWASDPSNAISTIGSPWHWRGQKPLSFQESTSNCLP